MSRSDVESKLGLHRGPLPGQKRLRLTVAYCGTPWRGWQSLDGGATIQDELQAAVLKATRLNANIQGSGRTDAGVHAFEQVAHMDVPESLRMNGAAWCDALNACLPKTIRITAVRPAPPDFHARFSAIGKVYRYRIWRPRSLSPFEADRAWHVYGPLDLDALRYCAQRLTGTHNFVRLSANRGDMPETQRRLNPEKCTRTLQRIDVTETGDTLEIELEGDGFLYKMVRMIVGSFIHVARGRAPAAWLNELIESPEGLQTTQTAPACGLYLMRVNYADTPQAL